MISPGDACVPDYLPPWIGSLGKWMTGMIADLDGEASVAPAAPLIHVCARNLSNCPSLLNQRQHVRLTMDDELAETNAGSPRPQ